MIIDVHRHMWSVLERHHDTFSGMDIPGRAKAERPDLRLGADDTRNCRGDG